MSYCDRCLILMRHNWKSKRNLYSRIHWDWDEEELNALPYLLIVYGECEIQT